MELEPWIKVKPSFLDKQDRLKITIFGPYGAFEERLKNITKALRERFKFYNTFLVSERNEFRSPLANETVETYLTNKSYYYLETSNVNIFVYYCNAHNESPSIELKHICDHLPKKIECCAVIKDTSCKMPTLLRGEIQKAPGLVTRVEKFDGRKSNCDKLIAELAKAKCINFLKTKFNEI